MQPIKYLLDTSTLTYFLQKDENIIRRLKKNDPTKLAISVISLIEIEYGFNLKENKHDILYKKWQEFLKLIKIFNLSEKTPLIAAEIKYNLKQKEIAINLAENIIAATALEHDLICVTSKREEFSHIKGLRIQDWKND